MEIIRRDQVPALTMHGIASHQLQFPENSADATAPFAEGDVVRFAEGDVHGLRNTGTVPFEYVAVTAPPINFRDAYAARDAVK